MVPAILNRSSKWISNRDLHDFFHFSVEPQFTRMLDCLIPGISSRSFPLLHQGLFMAS